MLPPLVDPARLIPPEHDAAHGVLEGLPFPASSTFVTRGEKVLLSDPTYLADVYGDADDPVAEYVREHGAFLSDFGGDSNGPVWWSDPFLVIPISLGGDEDQPPPPGVAVLTEDVGCDSGSFVFLPLSEDLPAALRETAEALLAEGNAALLPLPAGRYNLLYEQHDAPQPNLCSLYRNLVAHRESGSRPGGPSPDGRETAGHGTPVTHPGAPPSG